LNEIRHGRSRLNQAAELLHGVLVESRAPADSVIDRYFRSHKQMGSKDRAFAAETVYGCLRRKAELEFLVGPDLSVDMPLEHRAFWIVGVFLLKYSGWSARALSEAGFKGEADVLVARVRTTKTDDLPFNARINMPEWLTDRLLSQFGEAETLQLSEALNRPAQVGIRANTLKTSRDGLLMRLAEQGYPCEPMRYSPIGVQRDKRGPLFDTPAFKAGLFELQDEGSQLLGLMLEAMPKHKIVDFCAGAGGKSLELAAQMQNKGTLYACDISAGRLDRLKQRLTRAGADNIQRLVIRDEHDVSLRKLAGTADAVLVDAPCSGTGTLRRNPDIKWRPVDLGFLMQQQASILEAASRLVKPGGRLVYGTCSLLDQENAGITTAFLNSHPEFQVIPAREILDRQGVDVADGFAPDGSLRLMPHRHGTDGFYALALQRKASV
jgi:16S rRNA (cytosine967-C5)-methyltransferase